QQIHLDPKKLKAYEVGLTEVSRVISGKIKNIPTGLISNDEVAESVRVHSPISNISSIENLIVRSSDLRNSINVNQLGRVQEGRKSPKILARLNGQPAVLIVVTKKGEADAVTVVEKVKTLLTEIQKKRVLILNSLSTTMKDSESSIG
ncbi:MAG: efflux RND transporter permease subunit, partial [Pseudobdellovibrio sp.]